MFTLTPTAAEQIVRAAAEQPERPPASPCCVSPPNAMKMTANWSTAWASTKSAKTIWYRRGRHHGADLAAQPGPAGGHHAGFHRSSARRIPVHLPWRLHHAARRRLRRLRWWLFLMAQTKGGMNDAPSHPLRGPRLALHSQPAAAAHRVRCETPPRPPPWGGDRFARFAGQLDARRVYFASMKPFPHNPAGSIWSAPAPATRSC
jgi:hypothetical protein